ncbi:MAG: glycosyltransferase family 4 protein [Cellvibrionaceae bacterium]
MRVFYISPSVIPSRAANSIHVVNMCEAFTQHDCEVTLFVRSMNKDKSKCKCILNDFYGVDNKKINVEPYASNVSRGAELVIAFKAFGAFLKEKIKGSEPNYIVSRNLYAAVLIALLFRKRLVYETHAPEKGLRKILQKHVVQSDRVCVVVISQALKSIITEMYDLPDSTIMVLHDAARAGKIAIDEDEKKILQEKFLGEEVELPKYEKIVGYFGHLYSGRGIDIIEGLAVINKNFAFIVYGGNDKEITDFRKNNSSSNLFFMGHISPERVQTAMSMMDVLLMPYQKSVSVGVKGVDTAQWMSPMKMFEYMSTGVPIISSDLPVLREVLTHGENALLAKADSVEEWSSALQQIYVSKSLEKKLGRSAFREYQDKYTWKKRVEIMMSFLSDKQNGL